MGEVAGPLWLLGTTGAKPDTQTFHTGLYSAATWAEVPSCAHAVQQCLVVPSGTSHSQQWPVVITR